MIYGVVLSDFQRKKKDILMSFKKRKRDYILKCCLVFENNKPE